jgi:hypothetical protein
MKKLLLFIWVITLNSYLFAWDDPVYLTDSLANNYEPLICRIDFYEGESNYLFWVRETDSAYNAIYARNMYSESEPVLVTELDTCTYRNPRIIHFDAYSGYEEDFIFLYESNESGVFNIYCKVYDEGVFGETFFLEESEHDQNHMVTTKEYPYYNMVIWEENGEIHLSNLDESTVFQQSLTLDEGGCSNPCAPPMKGWDIANSLHIAWIKPSDGSENKSIVYTEYYPSINYLGENIVLHESANIDNLKFGNNEYLGEIHFLFWDNINIEGSSTLYGYDFQGEDYFISNFTKLGLFNPTAFPAYIPVSKSYHMESFLAFEFSEDTYEHIYANDFLWIQPEFQNYQLVSNLNTESKNPSFFLGAPSGYLFVDVFLVWESTFNNITRIVSRKTIVGGGGVGEDSEKLVDMQVSPNPIKDYFHVSFNTKTSLETYIELSTIDGKRIGNRLEIKTQAGNNEFGFSLSDFNMNPKNGIYLLKIKVDNGFIAKKLIVSD